jgi:hypothetical protein
MLSSWSAFAARSGDLGLEVRGWASCEDTPSAGSRLAGLGDCPLDALSASKLSEKQDIDRIRLRERASSCMMALVKSMQDRLRSALLERLPEITGRRALLARESETGSTKLSCLFTGCKSSRLATDCSLLDPASQD